MAVNIGPKIGIEGEKEYRKQLNGLITQQKTFSAEMRELESSFDESTSAMEKNRKKGELLEKQIANQEKTVAELEKGLEACKEKYGENEAQTQKWKQAVSNAKSELNKMKSELNKIPRSLENVGKSMQTVGKKMQSIGEGMTKYVTAPLTAMGAASIAAWKEVDEGLDIVVKKTGATGEALNSLQESVKTVATTIPTSFETAGSAIGEVNTRFGLTGTELETLSGKFIKFAELNNTDVSSSVDNVQKIMAAFGLETKDAGAVLDVLNKTGQNTGIDMNTLQTSLLKNSSALQGMGMDAYSAAGFLGQVETSGADTSQVMSGLQKALVNAADDGQTLPQALSNFQGIMNSTASDQEKLTAAIDLFGKKAGPAIFEACKQGSLSFENFSADAETYLGSVETTFNNVIDPADEFQIALNKVKTAGSEIGETLLKVAAPRISRIGEIAKEAGEKFGNLTEDQQNMVTYMIGAFAIGGPALTAVGHLVESAGTVVEAFGKVPGAIGKVSGVALPVGVAIAAFTLLKAGIDAAHQEAIDSVDGLGEMLSDTAEATTALEEATGELQKSISETQDNIDAINGKDAVAQDLINELYELESVTNKTTAQQNRMKSIVGQLNAMYPGLALAIDETTGSLTKGKGEVKDYVKEAKRIALLEAYTTGAKNAFEKLASAQKELHDAQNQQDAGLEKLTEAYHNYWQALEDAPTDLTTGQKIYTDEVARAETAYIAARDAQAGLNTAVHNAKDAISEAESECAYYTEQQEELSTATEENTAATEGQTEAQGEAATATGELASATDDAIGSTEDYTEAISESVGAIADMGSTLVSTTAQAAKAWDDQYKSAYDSISSQLGLFDEWEQDTEITAGKILENLNSQITGMTNYNSNMEKLTAAAVASNDPNFKAFVKAVSEMGIGAAGHVQALVDAMENDKGTFNEIVSSFDMFESTKERSANNTAYIANDFQTKAQTIQNAWTGALKKIGSSETFTKLKEAAKVTAANMKKEGDGVAVSATTNSNRTKLTWGAAYLSMYQSAQTTTAQTVSTTQTSINGMKLNPKISSIGVPVAVTSEAKATAQSRLDNMRGRLEKIEGAGSAASAAKQTASAGLQNIKGTMEISNATSAAEKARSAIQNLFNNNPITSIIRTVTQNVEKHAMGGIVEDESISWLAEGNNAEAVIPLEAHRARALSLYDQVGTILGVNRATAPQATVSMPVNENGYAATSTPVSFDTDSLFAAVASAAKSGMESANVRIYWDGREAGRIMKDMGVQFA